MWRHRNGADEDTVSEISSAESESSDTGGDLPADGDIDQLYPASSLLLQVQLKVKIYLFQLFFYFIFIHTSSRYLAT